MMADYSGTQIQRKANQNAQSDLMSAYGNQRHALAERRIHDMIDEMGIDFERDIIYQVGKSRSRFRMFGA